MKKILILALSLLLMLLLPPAGIILGRSDLQPYLSFPPATGYVKHSPFSWVAFALIAGFIVFSIAHPIFHIIRSGELRKDGTGKNFFPWWGYAGICAGSLSWIIAWTRFPLMHDIQRWTFVPLWISYIVVVNAFCVHRSGRSLLTHSTGYLLLLFPASAAFWWLFEYLNRFTANWYYTGTSELSPLRYFLEATLAFSTVLPAVMSSGELIKTFPRLYAGMDSYVQVRIRFPRLAAFITLIVSGAGLSLTALYPEWFFPLLWISPVVIILSLQSIAGEDSFTNNISSGEWSCVVVYALAALFCGFFWEMWNINSQAKWIYSIPYVHRFRIFEMPLLGYAGYLPFGVECAVVAGIFSKRGEELWRSC